MSLEVLMTGAGSPYGEARVRHSLFEQSPVNGHLGCFRVSSLAHDAVENAPARCPLCDHPILALR